MKLPRFVIFAGLVLLLTAINCGPRRGQLKGEVFIVTKGGENIKLGLVEVTIISETEINAAIEKKKAAVDPKLVELRSEYDKATAEYNSIHQTYQRAKGNYDKSSQRAMDAIISDNYEQAAKTRDYWSGEQMRLLRPDQEAESKQSQAKWRLDHFPTAEYFFESLPQAFGKTITNSNGEFTFELPVVGKFALAAHAERQMPEEKYYWLVWVSLDGQPSKTVLLSNHNVMTSDSAESVTKAKAMSF
jgi:hypothetical protein